jgi:hypothetical protein
MSDLQYENLLGKLRSLSDQCRPLRTVLDLAERGEELPQAAEVLSQHAKALRRLLHLPAPSVRPTARPSMHDVQRLILEIQSLERSAETTYLTA